MRFLLDENAEFRISTFLKSLGHDVTAIAYEHPASLADTQVLAIAHQEARILITNDRDFGDLIFRLHLPHSGVIYFRLPLDTTAEKKIDWLKRIFAERAADLGQYLVVEPHRIRVRQTPR